MVRGTITFFYKFSIIVVTSKNENTLFDGKGRSLGTVLIMFMATTYYKTAITSKNICF